MRYWIYFAPCQTSKRIDVQHSTSIQEIIDLIQKEFDIRISNENEENIAIILNYNGADLKPTWLIGDLNIPPGTILHCFYRDLKPADLYVHCGFNKQVLELFDDTITTDMTIAKLRTKIANKLGIPLSTFWLEMYHCEERLFDQMKLYQYDLKPSSHVFLRILYGYDKFIRSCLKGFTQFLAHDELTRDYEHQIALHIAAFHGYLQLANSALRRGARSDRPVGEHPSRQWFSEETVREIPEMLICPIHVAIERGHMKIVDLCVRHSIMCTQLLHPLTGLLPYRVALSMCISSTTKSEKQKYGEIYLYLQDKQFNLKIPLNANSSSVLNLLKMNGTTSFHRKPAHLICFSLPRYCKIITWYARAKERVWKKYGCCIERSIDIKRSHQSKGVLGYKVSIDGFTGISTNVHTDFDHRSVIYSEEERNKLSKIEVHMKKTVSDLKKAKKKIDTNHYSNSKHHRLLVQRAIIGGTVKVIDFAPPASSVNFDNNGTVSESTFGEDSSIFSDQTHRVTNTTLECETPDEDEYQHWSKPVKFKMPELPQIVSPSKVKENYKHSNRIPSSMSTSVTNSSINEMMSSVEAYSISSSRIAAEKQQKRLAADREQMQRIKASFQAMIDDTSNAKKQMIVTTDTKKVRQLSALISLPEKLRKDTSSIRSRYDRHVQQETLKSYDKHASQTNWKTALDCLDEATHLKRKPWVRQVDLSKTMAKHKVKRNIHQSDTIQMNKILSST